MMTCFKSSGRFESTDRGPIDYSHFGIIFAGIILGAAGVVVLSKGLFLFGGLLVGFALAYFWMETDY